VHGHSNGALVQDHGDAHVHSHALPLKRNFYSQLVMGFSGAMVKCPEVLGRFFLSIGLHRIVLGLGFIASFSLG
jgi:ABC-type nickel/cobalt efflux system permease component RcnA